MTQEVAKAFEEQRKINFMLAKDKSIEVDGYSDVYKRQLWHLALWVMKHIFQKINPNLLLLY